MIMPTLKLKELRRRNASYLRSFNSYVVKPKFELTAKFPGSFYQGLC